MRQQHTIRAEVRIEGIGLHTGRPCAVLLRPAARDTGVVFVRKGVRVPATLKAVAESAFCTTLAEDGVKVRTVEHLLAALAGLGVDNLLVQVQGPEIPILDGSAQGFARQILQVGLAPQRSPRPHLEILRPFAFKEGHAEFYVLPYPGRRITYVAHFPHRLMGLRQMSLELTPQSFLKEVAPARTFGFLRDVQRLRAKGLARGGSLENAVVFSETGVLNPGGLRFHDEFLRHKLLDFLGDLSLLGFPIRGYILAKRTGHKSNVRFAQALLRAQEVWQVRTSPEEKEETSRLNYLSQA
jgi:UDP-3-O-[3-hydroxymyristoyl] N-acetylglucosamine deacetylase